MKNFLAILSLLLYTSFSCISPLENEITGSEDGLVVYGTIRTTAPPYTVFLTESQQYNGGESVLPVVTGAKVVLYEENGPEEILSEIEPGIYRSCEEVITGRPGYTYWLEIQTAGQQYYSKKETMPAIPLIQNLRYEESSRNIISGGNNNLSQEGIDIFIDFEGRPEKGDQYLVRYRGTYQVKTEPESHKRGEGGSGTVPDPHPCSGYIYTEETGLIQVDSCICCDCWIVERWENPVLIDDIDLSAGKADNLRVSFVPTEPASERLGFNYWVGVEVVGLTRSGYEFYRMMLEQISGNNSLFQPPPSDLPGNIITVDSDKKAMGHFFAMATSYEGFENDDLVPIKKKSDLDSIPTSCRIVGHGLSTNENTPIKPYYYPF